MKVNIICVIFASIFVVSYGKLAGKFHEEWKSDPVKVSSAPPVNVSLYFESRCPYCRNFILKHLYPAYMALKSSGILNIKLYPYGNCKESRSGDKWAFRCQHGLTECQVNLVETCALHLLPPEKKVPFIRCVEYYPQVYYGKICAKSLGVEWIPIYNCYKSSLGNELEHKMALATAALKPRKRYVPWLTLNGVHNDGVQRGLSNNMVKYVCNAYTGDKPAACKTVLKDVFDEE